MVIRKLTSVALVAAATLSLACRAETNVWVGTTGSWHTDANWSLGHEPQDGEDVLIGFSASVSPVVCVTRPTGELASLVMKQEANAGSGTIIVSNWNSRIYARDMRLLKNATVRNEICPLLDLSETNRVWLAGETLTLASGAKIQSDQCGWVRPYGLAWNHSGGTSSITASASYGGWNFASTGFDTINCPYGDPEWPTLPGSSTTVGLSNSKYYAGGAVRLDFTGAVRLDGDVSVCGSYLSSGGSVLINCLALTGSGRVHANGFLNSNNGTSNAGAQNKGPGGRIAVHYDAMAQAANLSGCSVSFEARGGFVKEYAAGKSDINGFKCEWLSGNGTLWFTDNQFLMSSAYRAAGLPFSGVWMSGEELSELSYDGDLSLNDGYLEFPAVTNFCVSGSVSARGRGKYARAEFGLRFLRTADMTVAGSVTLCGARLELAYGGNIRISGDLVESSLGVATSAPKWDGGAVVVRAACTNDSSGVYGATVSVGGTWILSANSTCMPYCNPTNGAIVALSAKNLVLDEGATIDAQGKGYRCVKVSATTFGYGGPAKGVSMVIGHSAFLYGASHGGRGGSYVHTETSKDDYCSPKVGKRRWPLLAGSRGHSGNVAYCSCHGGGVVFLTVERQLTLNGTITADAVRDYYSRHMSGGAGGSVCISTFKLTGTTGKILARGGIGNADNAAANGSGVGGGGRIAVHYKVMDGFSQDVVDNSSVAPGVEYGTTDSFDAEEGTMCWIKDGGTAVLVR